jgi:hypothetical protein
MESGWTLMQRFVSAEHQDEDDLNVNCTLKQMHSVFEYLAILRITKVASPSRRAWFSA